MDFFVLIYGSKISFLKMYIQYLPPFFFFFFFLIFFNILKKFLQM